MPQSTPRSPVGESDAPSARGDRSQYFAECCGRAWRSVVVFAGIGVGLLVAPTVILAVLCYGYLLVCPVLLALRRRSCAEPPVGVLADTH